MSVSPSLRTWQHHKRYRRPSPSSPQAHRRQRPGRTDRSFPHEFSSLPTLPWPAQAKRSRWQTLFGVAFLSGISTPSLPSRRNVAAPLSTRRGNSGPYLRARQQPKPALCGTENVAARLPRWVHLRPVCAAAKMPLPSNELRRSAPLLPIRPRLAFAQFQPRGRAQAPARSARRPRTTTRRQAPSR